MTKENNCCWYTRARLNELHEASSKDVVQVNTLPQFQIVTGIGQKTFGCIFNRPQEDYTYDKSITNSLNGYIYDNIWDKFINERYNVQNKKVTAYINIQPIDFINFKFNKFITLNNQLFIVNKIFDYDMNGNGLTKVELIQVTDMDVYKNGAESFPPIVISPNEVDIIGSLHQGISGGSMALLAHITYFDANGEIDRGYWGSLVGTLILSTGQILTTADQIWNYVYLEAGDWESNIGSDSMYLYWENMTGAVFRGTLDYTLPDGTTYQIPITIDYTK
jgi:hypothetical protein